MAEQCISEDDAGYLLIICVEKKSECKEEWLGECSEEWFIGVLRFNASATARVISRW